MGYLPGILARFAISGALAIPLYMTGLAPMIILTTDKVKLKTPGILT
jgi:hypothetical protein